MKATDFMTAGVFGFPIVLFQFSVFLLDSNMRTWTFGAGNLLVVLASDFGFDRDCCWEGACVSAFAGVLLDSKTNVADLPSDVTVGLNTPVLFLNDLRLGDCKKNQAGIVNTCVLQSLE